MRRVIADVVYFLNDHMAFGGLQECDARSVSVPEHLGVAGFNGLAINDVLNKKLTTSISPRTLMGETGARMLVCRINGVETDESVCLPVELVPATRHAPRKTRPWTHS